MIVVLILSWEHIMVVNSGEYPLIAPQSAPLAMEAHR